MSTGRRWDWFFADVHLIGKSGRTLICNSTDGWEGYFHGKRTASRRGSNLINVTVGKRSREYLTDREVERLIEAAKQNRFGHRNATAILVAYRHGLKSLRGGRAGLGRHRHRHGAIACAQGQGRGCQCASDIGPGKSALRKLLRESPASPYVFMSERRAPLSVVGYQRMVARAGVAAKFTFPVIPTCCGTPAGSSSPTTVTTLAPSRPISATARSCPRSAIEAVSKWLSGVQLMEQRFGLLRSSQQRAAVATARASRQFSAATRVRYARPPARRGMSRPRLARGWCD
jgi:hypothetical protein